MGWALSFAHETDHHELADANPGRVEFGCDDYEADIAATLPSGLSGGTYKFTIYRMTDEHFQAIKTRESKDAAKALDSVRLYLYWADNPDSALGYVKNLFGLSSASRGDPVADLRVTGVKRAVGDRGYTTEITARERIYDIVAKHALTASAAPATSLSAAVTALLHTGLNLNPDVHYVYHAPATEPTISFRLPVGPTVLELLTSLTRRLEQANGPNSRGRGMFLIRNGTLHIGKRNIPLTGTDPVALDEESGLLEVKENGKTQRDPNAPAPRPPVGGGPKPPDATRKQYIVTLRGRPDLRPGDLVRFDAPPDDGGAMTDAKFGIASTVVDVARGLLGFADDGGTATTMYVDGVDHKIARTSGFITTLTGVAVTGADTWDAYHCPPQARRAPSSVSQAATTGDAATAVTKAIFQYVESRELPDVGEVRSFTARDGGSADAPAQTERVWSGLACTASADDVQANPARASAIDRAARVENSAVPYLTPFAWGKCGLVLPRYPKTRVLLAFRAGDGDDPVDVGALWRTGHAPTSADPGDWWLTLPAAVAETDRAAVADPPAAPGGAAAGGAAADTDADYAGKVSQDLIDPTGRRAIEVAQLAIKLGTDTLANAGTKPVFPDSDVVCVIEHTDTQNSKTARITIKSDASIEISSDKGMKFTSAGDIEMTATNADITLNAKDVKVKVTGTMDVSS